MQYCRFNKVKPCKLEDRPEDSGQCMACGLRDFSSSSRDLESARSLFFLFLSSAVRESIPQEFREKIFSQLNEESLTTSKK